ncbi:fimbrial protein [Cronobacter sakazakii]|uniref:fimbrial protein n=1 Tax=Cronobacter sakazakii TaxID=28141 RepID=UPI0013FE4200|nr:fimbrial protein [Cronobacter sakazakii]EKK5219892.1 type 1 fimbrial protein [Cronobacter sakazakii]ELY3793437.1 type 1 fimbrial protein [Cronobacter sakazakii]ELY3828361.1 type 1 fimbrial protein [Cronobacter sakazakii]ELY4144556.1 type 1 fimbrial protein [Cronobacter sakazakii]MDT3610129.1 fimbrial protein [Cronobacter sakazakii]
MIGNKRKLLALSLLLALSGGAAADEESEVNTGALYVHGVLQDNTCRMDMDSAWQEVDLGTASRGDFNLVGKAARPVTVKIYLHDCPEMVSWSTNITPMTTTASTLQPSYKARFTGVADELNPELIKVIGASGIGLRLRDSQGKSVVLSRTGDAVLLSPGQSQVTFTLAAERNGAAFTPGAYHSVINFSMIYQ